MIRFHPGRTSIGGPLHAALRPNILNLVFTGFLTDPTTAADGQRAQALQFQSLRPTSDFLIWSWDQDGWGSAAALAEYQALLAIIQKGSALGAYSHILADGHSFGGGFLVAFLNWLRANALGVDLVLARFLDPVLNPFDATAWTIPLGPTWTVRNCQQWTQRNGVPATLGLFPNGTPVAAADPFQANKVGLFTTVDFPAGTPDMDHVKLITDPRVWGPSLQAMLALTQP